MRDCLSTLLTKSHRIWKKKARSRSFILPFETRTSIFGSLHSFVHTLFSMGRVCDFCCCCCCCLALLAAGWAAAPAAVCFFLDGDETAIIPGLRPCCCCCCDPLRRWWLLLEEVTMTTSLSAALSVINMADRGGRETTRPRHLFYFPPRFPTGRHFAGHFHSRRICITFCHFLFTELFRTSFLLHLQPITDMPLNQFVFPPIIFQAENLLSS